MVSGPSLRQTGLPTSVSADLMAPTGRLLVATTLALVATVGVLVVWSAFATLEEVAQGRGRVIPASRIQVVQNLEGGIVRDILVREGQNVAEGDVVLRIDPTHFDSSLGEAREKIAGLSVLVARLEAEVEGREPRFGAEIDRVRPDIITEQQSLFESRRRELGAALGAIDLQFRQRQQEIRETESRVGALEKALAIASEELSLLRPLERSRSIARTDVLQIEAKVNEISGNLEGARLALPRIRSAEAEAGNKRIERESNFKSDALQKLTQARVDLRSLQEQTRGAADRVLRTVVRAPVSGIVKTVNITTPGQVVQPGSALLEIVPANDTLLVEAQVRPQDIAFIRPGDDAVVKITAYDFAIYGALEGKVEHIGADSVTPEKGESYYPVRVRTARSALAHRGETLPIMPGMVAEVDILTGKKSVLAYLMKPILRAKAKAMTER